MSFIDLSHDIVNDMSTYPTDPNVSINRKKNIKNNNSLLHQFKMGTHTGTHLDVPAHILENGKTLDNFSIDSFCGKAVKVDFGESDNLDKIDYNIEGIILNTGWYKNFNKPDIFYGKNRPKIPRNLIDYVLSNKLKFFCCCFKLLVVFLTISNLI